MENFFFEITALLGLATVLAIVFKLLKQPPILAYILTGILLASMHIIEPESAEAIQFFAEVGITLLLFMLGLELKISELQFVGKVALVTGLGQILVTSILGFLLVLALGFSPLASIYISLALTFSSTIIIVKLLSDKRQLATLYGKISVSILLIQDFVAILMLVLLSGLNSGGTDTIGAIPVDIIFFTLIKAVLMFIVVMVASNKIFPRLIRFLSTSQEVLFVFTIGWAFGVAYIAGSEFLGLSIEIGGFLAGLALANSLESYQIITKIRPLRDFFIILFFVNLGLGLQLTNIGAIIPTAILLSGFVLIGIPIIVMLLMRGMSYRKHTSFRVGVSLAQISEFSLILIFLAKRLGHIDDTAVSLVTVVAVITFVFSTYFSINLDKLYKWLTPYLGIFEKKRGMKSSKLPQEKLKQHVVVVGANRIGMNVISKLKTTEQQLVVVDFDPELGSTLGGDIKYIPGDIANPEVQEEAGLETADVVVSTIPKVEDNIILITHLRKVNKKVKIIATVHRSAYSKALYEAGADHVIFPYEFVGNNIGNIVRHQSYDKLEKFQPSV